jgi:hypothetical protein
MGFSGDLAQLWFFCLKNIYTYTQREREEVVVAWLKENGTSKGLKAKKHSHQTITKATTEDAVSGCNDVK